MFNINKVRKCYYIYIYIYIYILYNTILFFNGLDHAHVEDGYRVEDEPRDLKSLGQVLAPGEEDVGDEDIGIRLFQDSFDLRLDEVRCHVDFCGGGSHGG